MRWYKHLIGLFVCGCIAFIPLVIGGLWSFASLSDSFPTEEERQTAAMGRKIVEVMRLPTSWLLGDGDFSEILSLAIWSVVLYGLAYSFARLYQKSHV